MQTRFCDELPWGGNTVVDVDSIKYLMVTVAHVDTNNQGSERSRVISQPAQGIMHSPPFQAPVPLGQSQGPIYYPKPDPNGPNQNIEGEVLRYLARFMSHGLQPHQGFGSPPPSYAASFGSPNPSTNAASMGSPPPSGPYGGLHSTYAASFGSPPRPTGQCGIPPATYGSFGSPGNTFVPPTVDTNEVQNGAGTAIVPSPGPSQAFFFTPQSGGAATDSAAFGRSTSNGAASNDTGHGNVSPKRNRQGRFKRN